MRSQGRGEGGLPVTFTDLFIRHNLKSWNWVEALSELTLPLAVFVLSRPPLSPSSQCSGLVRPLPPPLRPEHRGITGCPEELQGGRERREQLLRHIIEGESRGGQYEGLSRRQKRDSGISFPQTLGEEKYSSGSLFHMKTRAHPTALEYSRLFPYTPEWVHEKPAELVVAPFLSLLEFVQRIIFLH